MFKLLKWAAYGLVAYAVYEFVSGMRDSGSAKSARPGRQRTIPQRRSLGRMMTGPQGRGKAVSVSDGSGVQHNEHVGRGVIS